MAEAKTVTILNQREGKFTLPPHPEELKKNPKAKHRELPAGQALEVSADEAEKLLRYPGIVDASKLVKNGGDSAEVAKLKQQLADKEKELAAERAKQGGAAGDDEGKKDEPKADEQQQEEKGGKKGGKK